MPFPKIIVPIAVVMLYAAITLFLYLNPGVNINTMLATNSYTVRIKSCGCFGCYNSTLNILDNKTATYSFKKYNPTTQLFENITNTIEWNKEKEQQLRGLFLNGIKRKNRGGCTTETKYTLSAFFFSASFIDGDCECERALFDIIGKKNLQ